MTAENTNKKKGSKKIIVGVLILVALIALLAIVYTSFREKPVEGSKAVTIEVIDKEQESTMYEVNTDAQYLRQAMEEAEGLNFEGTESEFGLTISTVNGVRADYVEDGAYWSFYVNGDYCNYGVDSQPVEDGDSFRIEYTPAE